MPFYKRSFLGKSLPEKLLLSAPKLPIKYLQYGMKHLYTCSMTSREALSSVTSGLTTPCCTSSACERASRVSEATAIDES